VEITQKQIEEWIATMATGAFHYTKVMDGVIPAHLYPKLRMIMHRLKDLGVCYPVNGKDGMWRPSDRNLQEVAWWESDGTIGENINLPLGINKYCSIPLPSIIIVAGTYNAGKTAFAINLINQNIDKWANKMHFFVSEGEDMMASKFSRLNSFIPKPPPFKMYRRMQNFADVIAPNDLNIIDYLRVDMTQTYAVAEQLFQIFNKLEKGIAVVNMQKPKGERKLAFGGGATAFEPTLYLSMDSISKDAGYVRFEKIKVVKPCSCDPYTLKINYKINYGVNFTDVSEVFE
jgi:hypothetical protein